MKNRSLVAAGRSLNIVAAAALSLLSSGAFALGLGRVNVQSVLGEPLRAEIEVTSLNAEESSSLQVKLASPDAFRASGVDFNPALAGAQITMGRRPDGRPMLVLTSDRTVQEPFVDVIVEFQWSTGKLTRAYTLLIDPPGRNVAAQPGTAPVPPVFSAPTPPAPRPAQAAAPAPAPAPVAIAPAPAPAPATKATTPSARTPAPAPVAKASTPAPSAPGGDTYKVKPGDTLSSVANATARPGVSLDQMLVALYRNNPQAFVDDNMNRMRSGVVLGVPSAETAKQTSTEEARSLIQAQSADFAAYRQRLAGAAPSVRTEEGKRLASGKVEAQVHDQKTAGAQAPDKLTLSSGKVAGGAADTKLSKEAEHKAAAARVAELTKNVNELKKLGPGPAAPAPAPTPATAAKTPVVPAITVAKAPAPLPTPAPAAKPSVPAPAPAPAPVAVAKTVVPAVPSAPAVAVRPPLVASAPVVTAAASAVASGAMGASAPVLASASAPRPAPRPTPRPLPAPAPVQEESFLSSLLDNPFALLGGGGIIALVAGAVLWRSRQRAGKFGSGETSFMESKIQPDSFFGASGGQRVDTRDGATSSSSSSLNYSLSQLDAIGDVDPVAEADVYLAYGRDLQAEEILKEAQRSDPDRLAIRTKLLEVYAKRADLKTFEAQARQLHNLTGGAGDDWAKAQELGRSIDPTNALYQEGVTTQPGEHAPAPAASSFGSDDHGGPLSIPASAELPPLHAEPVASIEHDALDLDIDLDAPVPAADRTLATGVPHAALDLPRVDAEAPARVEDVDTPVDLADFKLEPEFAASPAPAPAPAATPVKAAAPAAAPAAGGIDFDFGDLSLDLGAPAGSAASPEGPDTTPSVMPDLDMHAGADGDPMGRKIELADEFRRIGDHEGARELLEEVISKAEGPLRQRAQSMLDELS